MNSVLQVKDCLCHRMLKVGYLQKYHDVIAGSEVKPNVLAVFGEEKNFLGLVETKQAALFPGRVFSDLLVRRAPETISLDTSLDVVSVRFIEEKCEFIAVVDNGKFAGVISEPSLFAALIKQEKEMRQERDGLIKRLEVELDYRKLTTMVFENTSEGILVTDAAAHIIHVNDAFTKLTGYQLGEVLGKSPKVLYSGYQNKAFYEGMWEALLDNGSWEGEIWNRRKNGEIYPVWLHIYAAHDADGNVANYVGVFSKAGPNKEIQRELQQLAFYDPITALPNRRLFKDRLEQAIAESSRQNEGFALLFIDLDRFRDVNGAYGHAAGDSLLKHVALRIGETVRKCDTVARLGNDEFIVMLKDCHEARLAVAIAEKIVNALDEPVVLNSNELLASLSIGIALYPEDGMTAEEIIKSANAAMHHAKNEGVEFCFYKPEMNSGIADQLALESAIRNGLAKDEFWLAWQPQVRLADGVLTGAEVLARWRHEGRDIPPGKFIPIAENSGQIRQLGDWIFRTAVAEAAGFRKECCRCPLQVAVNFSPLQFKENDASRTVSEMLEKHHFDPGCLEVEITESALVDGQRGAMAFLSELNELGVMVAVDDFGTGYSNLSNLKRFHIDKLKIDQSFVFDLTKNLTSKQIVTAIINMAHSLGMVTLAEGVETKEQADILREMGCDYAQGYFFSRPVSISELKRLCSHCVNGEICLVDGQVPATI